VQIHGPTEVVHGIEVRKYGSDGTAGLSFPGAITIVLQTPADADELIKAAVLAKSMLLGETSAPIDKHGRYDAASAAEVAQGLDVLDGDGDDRDDTDIDARDAAEAAGPPDNSFRGREPCLAEAGASAYICLAAKGHSGDHMAYGPRESDGSYRAYHRWPHAAASRLAPPSGYGLKAIEVPADSAK
jgi:hypothetical protein